MKEEFDFRKETPDMYIEPEEQDIPKEEFDLSKEIFNTHVGDVIHLEDVKEFIRLLKYWKNQDGIIQISETALDKLAGNKLNQKQDTTIKSGLSGVS